MPYGADHRLEDMIDPDACEMAVYEIVDAGLDRFESNVKRNTPVDTHPYRSGERPRGALRASVVRGIVKRHTGALGRGFAGIVATDDEIAPYVEWDTAPHIIEPRRPGGTLSWRDREGNRHFAKRVHHPGTTGAHMFAIGAAITELELGEIADRPLERWAHDVTEPRPWRRRIAA